MIHLKKVDARNIWALTALQVQPEQTDFVATNTESILEAYVTVTSGGVALPFGIYDGEIPVGFLMIGYGCSDWEDAPAIADGNYSIWRLMIDRNHQGKGYGRQALTEALKYIRTFPAGTAKYVYLSYEPENHAARKLYHSFGFRENGEMDGSERVAVMEL